MKTYFKRKLTPSEEYCLANTMKRSLSHGNLRFSSDKINKQCWYLSFSPKRIKAKADERRILAKLYKSHDSWYIFYESVCTRFKFNSLTEALKTLEKDFIHLCNTRNDQNGK